jgi:ferredoxin-NADP reductase
VAATHTDVWQRARVIEASVLTPAIRRIVFEVDAPVPVKPGSHVDIRLLLAGETERRSYSVVDATADGRELAISVFASPTSRGGSTLVHSLTPGDELELTQPLLDFPLRIGAQRYSLLAGGIGITAISAMARVLKSLGADYELIYAGRSRSAMAYLDELQQEHGDRLRVHVGDEQSTLSVSDYVAELDAATELYMCGPIRLMDAVRRAWIANDLPIPNLRFETFGTAGWYDAQPFTVRVPALGIETQIGEGQSLLEALERAGADPMFDCRKGECGLCEVRVLELHGDIDHRDVFYSERQKDARGKMCCCVSRVVAPATADATAGGGVVTIEL